MSRIEFIKELAELWLLLLWGTAIFAVMVVGILILTLPEVLAIQYNTEIPVMSLARFVIGLTTFLAGASNLYIMKRKSGRN